MKKLMKIIFDSDKIPLVGVRIADKRFEENQRMNLSTFLQNVNQQTYRDYKLSQIKNVGNFAAVCLYNCGLAFATYQIIKHLTDN